LVGWVERGDVHHGDAEAGGEARSAAVEGTNTLASPNRGGTEEEPSMTKEEWHASTDPELMLRFARAFADDSTLRLFACACCVRVWRLIADERARRAVEIAERFARGLASRSDLDGARDLAEEAREDAHRAEYEAESESGFCYTARYCEINARLYAACAARQATSVSAADMDDDE
jgi:hypothetical protein